MTALRLIVPIHVVEDVLRLLRGLDAVTNIVHLPGAGLRPAGDLILCDVAREDVSIVVEQLIALGLDRDGSIALEAVDASVSVAARAAMQRAPGSPADAVLWEQVEQNVRESTDLSAAYVLFMAIATMIAAVGILTDSAVLIVGAMVVGPEFGPLAALCLAVVRRRPRVARASILALIVGFAIAIAASLTLTAIVRALDLAPIVGGARGSLADLLHLAPRHVLRARCAPRRGRRDAFTPDGEVERVDRRPHLGDHHPGGRERWCRRGVPRLGRVSRSRPPAGYQPVDDRRRRCRHACRRPLAALPQTDPAGGRQGTVKIVIGDVVPASRTSERRWPHRRTGACETSSSL